MLCEEDSSLFEAAKRAQVNRNTAIHVIDNARAGEILAGAYVRVLLEMPSRNEGYMVARIHGTSTGEPYSGFSTNTNQTTSVYLMLELPPPLAAINGVQYQLNSVSNSVMGEREFREWLDMVRKEPTLRTPTVQQLEEVASRIHPFEVGRHRINSHQLASSSSLSVSPAAAAARAGSGNSLQQRPPSSQPPQQQQQRALSARGANRQLRQSLAASTPSGLVPPLPLSPGADARSPIAVSSEGPLMHSPHGDGQRSASASADTVNGNNNNNNAHRFVRQGTMMTRDYNRNPREDGQASHDMADAEAPAGDFFANNNGRVNSPRTGGAGPASAAAIPFMTRGATNHQLESEDEEMERRLRQDILNHLAQECVLFPKDPKGYKLSRLRLLERDMIEYLQHVRDEIQGKQENCIVCMDHVPTVILLPCRHKVMCRLCAPSVSHCPVCRSQIEEMFEPEEV